MGLTDSDIAYLESQFLGRLATTGRNGRPHVVPVGVFYSREHGTIDIGGYRFGERKKYREMIRIHPDTVNRYGLD